MRHRFYSARDIAEILSGKETRPGEFQCKCPAHEDRVASLSVGTGRNGDTLIDCKAGCDKQDVLQALGLEWANLFLRRREDQPDYRPRGKSTLDHLQSIPRATAVERTPSPLEGVTHPHLGAPDAVYPYENERRDVIYVSARFSKPAKSFRQAQPDGSGGWRWSLSGIDPLPFHLPQLIEAVAEERQVVIVEGEKDVLNLEAIGIPATTNSAGAKKFPQSAVRFFAGAHVAIIGDNDQPGQEHARMVADLLRESASSVKVVRLPGLPEKGDVSDWLDAGGTRDELVGLIAAAERSAAPEVATSHRRLHLIDDVQLMSLAEPGWLNDGRIPAGATAQLFGDSGSFKSFVALDLACHIALGLDWHGRAVTQGNVVYVCAEGVHGMMHRVDAWKKSHGIEGKLGLYFLRHGIELKHGSADVRELLAEIAERLPAPPVMIVIDTLARNLVGNENAAEDMSGYVKGCDILRDATGATILSVHHSGYSDTDRARGSSSNRAAMDTDIQCTRDGDRVTLKNKKQKDAAEFADISFEAFPVAKSLVLKPMDQRGGSLDGNRLRSLKSLHQLDGPASHSAWKKAAELGKSSSNFNNARSWLESMAYVKRAAGQKYEVTDAGRQALRAASPSSITSPTLVHNPAVSVSPCQGGIEIPLHGLDTNATAATGTS